MSFAPLVGKEVFFCFSLDIQSYLLRFGVLCIFADPNTFSTSVWMSREKEKINQEQPKHRFSCWEQKSWMEFSLFPLKMDVVSKNDCSTGNGWLDPPTPNAPCLEYFDPRKLTWIPQMIISKRPFWKVYSMLDFWGAPTFTVNFWANSQIVQLYGAGRLDYIIRFFHLCQRLSKVLGPDTQIQTPKLITTTDPCERYVYLYGGVVFFHDRCKQHIYPMDPVGIRFFVTDSL